MVHAKDMTNLMNDTAQLVDAIAPTSVWNSWRVDLRQAQSRAKIQVHDDMTKEDKKES